MFFSGHISLISGGIADLCGIMVIGRRIKSALHAFAALLSLYYAFFLPQTSGLMQSLAVGAGLLFIGFSISHGIISRKFKTHPLWMLVMESIWLAVLAWALYQIKLHKATFFYEGISVFYFAMAAFTFLLRRKKAMVFTEE